MRILIAGGTGAIGRPSIRRLRANQHEVFALTRSPDSVPALKEIGAEPVITDALDAAAVKAAVGRIRPDAVINELAVSTKRPEQLSYYERVGIAGGRYDEVEQGLIARRCSARSNSCAPRASRSAHASMKCWPRAAGCGAESCVYRCQDTARPI
jgi:hypothetical protein